MIEQLRTSKISIDLPKPDVEVWIHITLQKVLRNNDYTIHSIISKFDNISIPVRELYMERVPTKTGSNEFMYGGELLQGITTVVLMLIMKKYGGHMNDKNDLIL